MRYVLLGSVFWSRAPVNPRHLARLDPGGGTGARHSAAARFPSLEFARGPPLLGDACAPGHAGAGAAPAVGPVLT